ncbi:DNA sulfur modification protein DndD [Saccharibacillus sp. CPCC 101409]|uniref:DNA sulfur modification protein DndD n=1 Tax=Saccharibacillus sp. CPCC 101409 TaxID=3058041 RepID=UPI0026720E42|nr:DNA sulfur modification protein DndD [Saccharibacillus sp. CPCC 101409]MDO3408389.1 DNA sulfur modification protein DndD [Saccharibacillus sp. CPCC 101409]
MQITKLLLRNIGAYHGPHHSFDFRTSSDKNVILLGGKNGAGKTTILESLRIVLFGSLAYGFMNDNEPYFKKIHSLLNRAAIQNHENEFQITLEYTATEEFEPIKYVLTRRWHLKKEKIKESFDVHKDGQPLDTQKKSDFQNRLREEMPPRLFELCLFDGEDISRIVSDEKIPEYLSESGKILFNLDLFMNLEKDLQTYRMQYAQKNASAAKEINDQQELMNKIVELQTIVEEKASLIVFSEDEITNLNDEIKQHKKDFDEHGGLQREERQKLASQVNAIENERKANTEQIRTFTSSLLPFYIAKDLLIKVVKQLDLEKENESFEYVSSALEKNKLNELVRKLQQSTAQSDVRLNIDQLHKGILEIMQPENIQLIHRASFAQRSEIHNLFKQIEQIDPKQYIQLYDRNAELLTEAQKLRKAIEVNDQSSEFKEILAQIETKTKRVEQLRLLIEQYNKDIHEATETIRLHTAASNKITDKIREYHKAENSFSMTEKLLLVSQRFRDRQWRKKLDDVANEATKMVNILFRKKEYIDRIHIDHSTFELHLYNRQQHLITKERLSAGEKEMLMLTVIWAMFKVSGWKLPFVFDTLMGRLDQDHKRALIQHFIPRCGDQVLMFTTDSEVSTEQYELLKDITARCYTLEFDQVMDSAKIVKGRYFTISEESSQL